MVQAQHVSLLAIATSDGYVVGGDPADEALSGCPAQVSAYARYPLAAAAPHVLCGTCLALACGAADGAS